MDDMALRDQLLHLLRGGNAHLTFDEAVANFPVERMNDRPPHVPYTPWHLLEHIRLAQWDILDGMAPLLEGPDDQRFEREARMVAPDDDPHGSLRCAILAAKLIPPLGR